MTNDFIYLSQSALNQMLSLLGEAEAVQAYAIDFERGETATLSVSMGDTTICSYDLKADRNGEQIKALLNQKLRDLLNCYRESLDCLTTFLEEEESRR